MKVNGENYTAIWMEKDNERIMIINQLLLPYKFETKELTNTEDVYNAILNMEVRGAPLIGATTGFGMYLACLESVGKKDPLTYIKDTAAKFNSTRPTAVNLIHATDYVLRGVLKACSNDDRIRIAKTRACKIADNNINDCIKIGHHGLKIIEDIARQQPGKTVNILTHCNAGWLACGDYGTATAPIYLAHDKGIKVHVWVDETRPRNQGSKLTAWELLQHGVDHTVIADNTGGHLMQNEMVDLVIVGCDRMALNGDFANKTGTYLKALAAYDNNIPFYAALPISSIDPKIENGLRDIPIEIRSGDEINYFEGWYQGKLVKIRISPENSKALNYGFDITPAKYVTGVITEQGLHTANKEDLSRIFS